MGREGTPRQMGPQVRAVLLPPGLGGGVGSRARARGDRSRARLPVRVRLQGGSEHTGRALARGHEQCARTGIVEHDGQRRTVSDRDPHGETQTPPRQRAQPRTATRAEGQPPRMTPPRAAPTGGTQHLDDGGTVARIPADVAQQRETCEGGRGVACGALRRLPWPLVVGVALDRILTGA